MKNLSFHVRHIENPNIDLDPIIGELYRVTKKGSVVVWVVGDATIKGSETGTSFRQALWAMDCGFKLHDTMFYHKIGCTLNHNRYEQEIEYMFVFSKGKPKTFNPIRIPCKGFGKDSDRTGQQYREHKQINCKLRSKKNRENIKPNKIKGNVWTYSTGFGHSTKDKFAFEHPAIFPEQLANDHIISWSNEGDLIYDPFMGSGTTAKMAMLNKRNYIGSEISKEYCEMARKRIDATPERLI